MSIRFTIQDLERLKAAGKIQGFRISEKKYSAKPKKNIPKHKEWLAMNLKAWCKANSLELKEELKFHPERKWRFDFAIPALNVAIEYEGLTFEKSGHTTSDAYTKNTEKYNAATAMGWKVFRYTYKNYKEMISDLEKVIK